MTTTTFFEEHVKCLTGNEEVNIEFGRSNSDEDTIYLRVNGKSVLMDLATAKKFVKSASDVGQYFGWLD